MPPLEKRRKSTKQGMKIPEIIFENSDLLVLNKPSGMLSVPDRVQSAVSLRELLEQKYGKIFTVHRLDKDTSGVILFAKNENAHKFFSAAFENRDVTKIYYGFVHGSIPEISGTVDAPIMEHPVQKGVMVVNPKGKPAITLYEVERDFQLYSFVKFQILTGRTHQIRVHSKQMDHPIVCDPIYGDGLPIKVSSFKRNYHLGKHTEEEKPLLGRLALHAFELSLTGLNGEPLLFTAPLPKDMSALNKQLEKWKRV
jgi:23S rRNA pseudouridine1911/1915/1917 synthase